MLVQNDLNNTHLPNGMLKWFGFEFDRAEMPEDPILKGEESPVWVGNSPTFTYKWGIVDGKLAIEVDEYLVELDDEDFYTVATPKRYWVTIDAPGMPHAETVVHDNWHDVQQSCKRIERNLDRDYAERHAHCTDENGNTTEDACSWCDPF